MSSCKGLGAPLVGATFDAGPGGAVCCRHPHLSGKHSGISRKHPPWCLNVLTGDSWLFSWNLRNSALNLLDCCLRVGGVGSASHRSLSEPGAALGHKGGATGLQWRRMVGPCSASPTEPGAGITTNVASSPSMFHFKESFSRTCLLFD